MSNLTDALTLDIAEYCCSNDSLQMPGSGDTLTLTWAIDIVFGSITSISIGAITGNPSAPGESVNLFSRTPGEVDSIWTATLNEKVIVGSIYSYTIVIQPPTPESGDKPKPIYLIKTPKIIAVAP